MPEGGRSVPRGARLLAIAAALSAALVAADLLPALAPPAWGGAARAAFEPTCHQMPERSLAVAGTPLASCARCTGLHASGLAAVLLTMAVGLAPASVRRVDRLRGAALAAWGLLAADVAAGMVVPGWDHPGLRFVTGLAAGATLLAWGAAALARERGALRAAWSEARA